MRKGCALVLTLLVLSLLLAAASAETAVDGIINARTTQSFTDEAVSDEDLRVILDTILK